jgi:hypothetical protein
MYRRSTNIKTKSTEERIPIVLRFIIKFWMFFGNLVDSKKAAQWDAHWGTYLPCDRYNSDQIPGAFETGNPSTPPSPSAHSHTCTCIDHDETWDEVGKEKVWIKSISPDAGKRVYTTHCCFLPLRGQAHPAGIWGS